MADTVTAESVDHSPRPGGKMPALLLLALLVGVLIYAFRDALTWSWV